MPYNQNGPNASTMAGTYNDVAGTQTNNISGGGSPGNMPEVGIQPGANVARFGTYNDVGGDQHNVTKVGTIRSLAIDGANQVTSYFERFKNTGNIVYNTNNTTNNSSQHTAGDSFTDARTTNNYNSISPGSGSSSYFPPLQDKDNTNTIRPISIPLVYDDLDQLADPNKAADDTPRSPPPLFHGSVTNRSTLRQQSNNELPKPPPKDDPVLEVEIPELRRRVQQLNDDIELCAIDIAGLYGQYLGHKLKHTKLAGFHTAVTELIRPGQERDATGVEVAIPCLQSLFSATLAQKIMEPFAPGIDADTNTQLSSIYRIVSSNEPRELRAIWRSITYKSCIHGRSSDGYATILSNEIVQATHPGRDSSAHQESCVGRTGTAGPPTDELSG
ncbi:hypothetical protein MSAN_02270600 [Mycena sanguinolenta]|uniref:Uncharacterized protein n=1 Tax=Mycena sanguinolenta TaxID=230812 RepID=A0A8H6X9K8_9AGAR|nr:hypothetical protein MSAN_02270600 [Mycena sanguinolenta]